ncbi:hypothetical protein [Streptomyces sp. NPDC001340]
MPADVSASERVLPGYDPGDDHPHFNDAGMGAVADTVTGALADSAAAVAG